MKLPLGFGKRRLELSPAGFWFVALTVSVGVVAIMTGNNVLLLVESLLLSTLILSGILSERMVSAVEIDWIPAQAVAGEKSKDFIRIKNHSRSPIFALEIGRYYKKKWLRIAFCSKLGAKEITQIHTEEDFSSRGAVLWDGFTVSTSFPFGFAKKIRLVPRSGSRLVWPLKRSSALSGVEGSGSRGRVQSTKRSDDELRSYDSSDDVRKVVWTLSTRDENWVVRSHESEKSGKMISLRRNVPDAEFEREVLKVASIFYTEQKISESQSTLVVRSSKGTVRLSGQKNVLNYLSTVESEYVSNRESYGKEKAS